MLGVKRIIVLDGDVIKDNIWEGKEKAESLAEIN